MAQHLTALEKANRIRLGRAEVKRRLHAGDVSFKDLILDPPEVIMTMTVYELLISQRQWARTRALRIINKPELRISETTTIRKLTHRQQKALVELVGESKKPSGFGY